MRLLYAMPAHLRPIDSDPAAASTMVQRSPMADKVINFEDHHLIGFAVPAYIGAASGSVLARLISAVILDNSGTRKPAVTGGIHNRERSLDRMGHEGDAQL